jgi:phosphoribosylanthranilate isomerase
MASSLTIKICGVRDPATARRAIELGADYVGLVLAESPRRLHLDEAVALVEASGLAAGRFVAVLRDPDPATWQAVLQRLPGVHLQVHVTGSDQVASDGWVKAAHAAGVMAIAGVNGRMRPVGWQLADVVLWDGLKPGSGQAWTWQSPEALVPGQHWWLAGGLTPENVGHALRLVRPQGVDVSSGVERKGQKDIERIARFIEEVRRCA